MASLLTAPLEPVELFLLGIAVFVSVLGFMLTRQAKR